MQHSVKNIGLLAAVAIMAGAIPARSADTPPPALTTEQAVLAAAPSVASVTGVLVVNAAEDKPIRLRAMPATDGDLLAPILFPDSKDSAGKPRDWIDIAPQHGAAHVTFSVAPPPEGGLYRGEVEAFREDGSVFGTAEILVRRPDPAFSVSIGGPALVATQLRMSTSNDSGDIAFTVKNTADKAARSFYLSVPEAEPPAKGQAASASGLKVTFLPQTFRLAPGQEEQVVAHLTDLPTGGSNFVLRVADAGQSSLYKDVMARVTRDQWEWFRRWWPLFGTLLLVILGAILSVMVRTIFPTILTKRSNRGSLGQAEGVIRRCTNASDVLKSTLLAESGRIRLVNTAVGWSAADRAQQFDRLDKLIAALQAKTDAAVRIASVRDAAATQANLPFAAIVAVEQLLTQAEELLLLNRPEAASAKIDEADTVRLAALSDANVKALRDFLKGMADRLAPPPPQPGPQNLPPIIAALAQEVVQARGRVDAMDIEELVRTEHYARIVEGYLEEFRPAVERNQDCQDFEALFISLLRTDRGPVAVRALAQVLAAGLTPNTISHELATGGASIVIEPETPPYQTLMQFELSFRNPQMQGTSAVRQLVECEWQFSDGTQPVRTARGQHYYLRRQYQWWQWLVARAPWRRLFGLDPDADTFPLVCTLKVPFSTDLDPNGSPKTFTARRLVGARMPTDGTHWSVVPVINFLITASISVLVAYAAQYSTTGSLDTLNACLTPFLFGFGLDQLRNPTVSK